MALITSAATGNFSAGATWTGGVVPTVGDEARASTGHTVTIDVNTTCDEVSNAGTGIFTLASGVTLTANVTSKSATSSRNCLQFTAASPAVAYIVGNCTGGSNATTTNAVVNTNTGALNITGNCTGGNGSQGGPTNGCNALSNASAGSVTITGNCTGGAFNANGAQNVSTGSIAVIGNCQGGTAVGFGVQNHSTGNITVVGISTGGSIASASGANNTSTGNLYLTRAKGSPYGPGNSGAGTGAAVGASNAGLGVIEIQELEYGEYGMSPTSGTGIRLKKLSTNVAVFNYVDAGSAKTLIDATANAAMPAATDVRDGVSYASGALTGSCKVPAAASTAFGVPVDNTTGTAVLTAAAIRSELSVELDRIDAAISSRLAPSGTLATVTTLTNAPTSVTPTDIWTHATRTITGGTVDTLTNAPTVPTAAAIADEVRVELATELANLDAPVSSASAPTASTVATAVRTELTAELAHLDADISTRATPADIPASDITAIKAKTDLLETTRLAQCSTVATTGAQLAAALS